MTQQSQWEKQLEIILNNNLPDNPFEKYFDRLGKKYGKGILKRELKTLFSSQRQSLIEKVEKMKKRPKHAECVLGKCEICDEDCGIELINKKLDDVINLLKEEA